MRCKDCGYELGGSMLPARCPNCGARLGNISDAMGAERASASRRGVEGLTGIGKGSTANKKRHARQLTIALVLAFFTVFLVLALLSVAKCTSDTGLADVVGWRSERAQQELENAGYVVKINEVASADSAGLVLDMSPKAGSHPEEGSTVTLEVAKARIMPDVVGKTREEAVKLLNDQNIPFEEETQVDDGDAEVVLASTILAGNEVTGETKTVITVSAKPTVPDLIGKTRDEARQLLEAQGLKMEVKEVSQVTGVPIGQIVKSDPVSGTILKKGDTVTVNVTTSKSKNLEQSAKNVIKAVFDTDVANNQVGANLRSLLSAESEYADATDQQIWYGLVKGSSKSHDQVDAKIQELDRELYGTPTYTVQESDNTVIAEVPVLWYWDNFGDEYSGVTSHDVHTVRMTFDDNGGLLTFVDSQGDVPAYEVVSE